MKKLSARSLKTLERRKRVADLYLEGNPQHKIALQLKLSAMTISSDLRKIREYWRECCATSYELHCVEQLARIGKLEQAYWETYRSASKPQETVTRYAIADEETGEPILERMVMEEGPPDHHEMVIALGKLEGCVKERNIVITALKASAGGRKPGEEKRSFEGYIEEAGWQDANREATLAGILNRCSGRLATGEVTVVEGEVCDD